MEGTFSGQILKALEAQITNRELHLYLSIRDQLREKWHRVLIGLVCLILTVEAPFFT